MLQTHFSKLQDALDGQLILPGDPDYCDARSLWNALIDKRPAAIARVTSAGDVIAAVNFARDNGLNVSVRGGGHNIAGTAIGDEVVMIDLSLMSRVEIDQEQNTACAQGGATLHDMDLAASTYGLATPGGVVSSTGIAGLTLGGGFGWLSRLYGLAADNLLSAEVVTAEGQLITVDEAHHSDLLWGMRGGGGNFGVALSFTFRLHAIPSQIVFGPTLFALDDAPEVLRTYRDFAHNAPRECCVWADLMTAPPFPFIPEQYHGSKVLGLMQCYVGDPDTGKDVLAPLQSGAAPIGTAVDVMSYVYAQQILDETYAKGLRNYWKSSNFKTLSDAAIDDLVLFAKSMPTGESDILISQLGGAIGDVPNDATAFPHRETEFIVTPGVRWRSAEDDASCLAWIDDVGSKLQVHEDGGQYVNFVAERDGDAKRSYGDNLQRLQQLKARYDPGNLFSMNQNIRPAN